MTAPGNRYSYLSVLSILLGIILGFFASSVYLSMDTQFKYLLKGYIEKSLSKGLGCPFNAKLETINLISGTLGLANLEVSNDVDNYGWTAPSARVTFSLMSLLLHKTLSLKIYIKSMHAHSAVVNNRPTIEKHINAWIYMPAGPIPTIINEIHFHESELKLNSIDYPSYSITIKANAELHITSPKTILKIAIKNAIVTHETQKIIDTTQGIIDVTIDRGTFQTRIVPHIKTMLTLNDHQIPLLVSGSCDLPKIDITLQTPNGTYATITGENNFKANGHVALKDCFRLAGKSYNELVGAITFNALLCDYTHLTAHVNLNTASLDGYPLPDVQLSLSGSTKTIHGYMLVSHSLYTANGSISLDVDERHLAIKFENTSDVSIPLLGTCKATTGSFILEASPTGISGSIAMPTENRHINHSLRSTINADTTAALIKTYFNNTIIDVHAINKGSWCLESISALLNNKNMCSIIIGPENEFNGTIELELIKDIAQHVWDMKIDGNGLIRLNGKNDLTTISTRLNFDGEIRLPQQHSACTSITTDAILNIKEKTVQWNDLHALFSKGSITSTHGAVCLDSNNAPSFMYAPFVLDSFFIHYKKDLIGTLTGMILINQQPESLPKFTGYLVLDNAVIEGNILSPEFVKNFATGATNPLAAYKHDAELDIALTSHAPIAVKTNFLTSNIRFNVRLRGTISSPQMFGTVKLFDGMLKFPYQPLYITHGAIYFLSHKLHDPTIELQAKNKIKKYNVSMRVTGSATSPKISFESSPALTEAQIITLLLGGSSDGSLYLAMPDSIGQNIQKLMFGPAESANALQRSIRTLFKPLKNVRIVPQFSDQYGRGGLRGALLIDINDDLRASIQQNFLLSEDVRIDVEYDLSDDTTIRATRDERGDIGAEIEKVWKF